METRTENSVSRLDANTIHEYRENGYIALPNVLTPDEVADARLALTDIVRDWVARGGDNAPSSPMVQFERGFEPAADRSDATEAEQRVRKFMWFVNAKPALASLIEPSHTIVKIVSQLIGPSPIMFQDMALVKPPLIGSEKPWHQDNAYFSVAPLDSICGVWIALDDADVDNGCMHVLPGKHKEGALIHHHGSDCEIAPENLPGRNAVAVPIKAGGAMFFYGMLPHRTPPNRSPERRRALQFHFRSADSRIVSAAEYNALYAENGVPASCAAAAAGI